jgi:hypothetical protein
MAADSQERAFDGRREATGTLLIAMHNANQDLNRVRNSNVLLFLADWRRYREKFG